MEDFRKVTIGDYIDERDRARRMTNAAIDMERERNRAVRFGRFLLFILFMILCLAMALAAWFWMM